MHNVIRRDALAPALIVTLFLSGCARGEAIWRSEDHVKAACQSVCKGAADDLTRECVCKAGLCPAKSIFLGGGEWDLFTPRPDECVASDVEPEYFHSMLDLIGFGEDSDYSFPVSNGVELCLNDSAKKLYVRKDNDPLRETEPGTPERRNAMRMSASTPESQTEPESGADASAPAAYKSGADGGAGTDVAWTLSACAMIQVVGLLW